MRGVLVYRRFYTSFMKQSEIQHIRTVLEKTILIFYNLVPPLSYKKPENKMSKMLLRYMLPVGLNEYPIEIEIRFPRDLNESIVEEIKRLFLPFKYAGTSFQQDEVKIQPGDFMKVETEKQSLPRKKNHKNRQHRRL